MNIERYRSDVTRWWKKAQQQQCVYLIITYNGSKRSIYPVYVRSGQSIQQKLKNVNDDPSLTPLEVYNMSHNLESQLMQNRTWNV